jgi:hypothetical protein
VPQSLNEPVLPLCLSHHPSPPDDLDSLFASSPTIPPTIPLINHPTVLPLCLSRQPPPLLPSRRLGLLVCVQSYVSSDHPPYSSSTTLSIRGTSTSIPQRTNPSPLPQPPPLLPSRRLGLPVCVQSYSSSDQTPYCPSPLPLQAATTPSPLPKTRTHFLCPILRFHRSPTLLFFCFKYLIDCCLAATCVASVSPPVPSTPRSHPVWPRRPHQCHASLVYQRPEVGYDETFSLVVKAANIRTVLTLAISMG